MAKFEVYATVIAKQTVRWEVEADDKDRAREKIHGLWQEERTASALSVEIEDDAMTDLRVYPGE